jgi:hypothetical protein
MTKRTGIRKPKGTVVLEFGGKKTLATDLAAKTGLSYYCLIGRYQAGDRDDDLVRPLGTKSRRWLALKAAKPKVVTRKDPGPARHVPKRQPNTERAQRERDAREREKAGLVAAFSRPLISEDILSPDERNSIHQRIGSGLRWHSEVDIA